MISVINSSNPILLVDDDKVILDLSTTTLHCEGITNVVTLSDSRLLLNYLETNQVSMVFLDLMMPHISGMKLLPTLSSDYPQIPVIVMTSVEDVDTAVNCMKEGAFDFLTKPVETARLLSCVEKAIKVSELRHENSSLRDYLLNDTLEHPEAFSEIITTNKKMRSIFQYIEVISKSDQPVLITGETGVGKELVARAIANLSRRPGEFVTVNVSGLDDTVFSDTLFGHKKGAFTGADQAREGLIGTAARGTLFLDEIGDLNESSQIKLLRLIQEHEYYPMGSDLLKKSDARIIVATNQDLSQRISEGKFRKDLFYRLCGHRIHIPALRERREDIPLLFQHFLTGAASSLGKARPTPSQEVVAMLSTCHFDGNIRELQAMVFDAVARHTTGMLTIDCFVGINSAEPAPASPSSPSTGNDLNEVFYGLFGRFPTIKEVEEYLITSAMHLTNGNQRSAAMLLGIARQTLSKRWSSIA
jgi:two-component system, NtrC family, response regulator HydG